MRLVPCSQILEDLHESWAAPTFWLRFNSWTAATTVYTASKRRAEESCRGGGRGLMYYTVTHTHTDAHGWGCNTVVSGQWGVNPSLEWKWDYSIRSLERLWSADSAETVSLSLLLCVFFLGRLCISLYSPQWNWRTLTVSITAWASQHGPETSGRGIFFSRLILSYSLLFAITTWCHVHLI